MPEVVALTERANELMLKVVASQPIPPNFAQVIEEALELLYAKVAKK